MCHLFQGTVGLGQSGPSSGGVAEAHSAQGSQMSHQHSSARWGWWGGLGLVSGSCRVNQAPSVSGLVLELEPISRWDRLGGAYGTTWEIWLQTI